MKSLRLSQEQHYKWHKEVLPRNCTRSWELGHSLNLGCPFLNLLSDIARFVADQDVEEEIFVTLEDWLVSCFTPVCQAQSNIVKEKSIELETVDFTCIECTSW